MSEDLEQRLAEAAEALREHQAVTAHCANLQQRIDEMTEQLGQLQAAQASEENDVERLEGLSLTRVLAAVRGSRDDDLAREQAEARAARLRTADAKSRLDAVRHEYEQARVRLQSLASAPDTYASLLTEKEAVLTASDDPRGSQLLDVADERGRLAGELHELSEAMQATDAASRALAAVQDRLSSASGWSTYDTFFGGGAISSAIKHSRLDEAAEAAAHADRCMAVLRTELADVDGADVTAPKLAVDGMTRFVDIWVDNFFTDLAVRERIDQAKASVAQSTRLVEQVRQRLEQRKARAHDRVAQLDQHRRELLSAAAEPPPG